MQVGLSMSMTRRRAVGGASAPSLRQQSIDIMAPLSGRIWLVGDDWSGPSSNLVGSPSVTGAGQQVQSWADIVVGVAGGLITQSVFNFRPTSSAALGTPKAVNFDGTNDRLTSVNRGIGTAYTVILAAKSTVMGAARKAFGAASAGASIAIGHDSGQQWQCLVGESTISSTASAGALSIVELRRDGASAQAWVNGASIGTASPALGGSGLYPLLGCYNNGGAASEFFGGQIAFFAIVETALTTNERETIARYAAQHCGLTYP